MNLNKIEGREIRSFRLRQKTLGFNRFFQEQKKVAWFVMGDVIEPSERLELKERFASVGLKLTFVSKKMVNLWVQTDDLGVLKNLLKGNVLKLEPISNEISESDIRAQFEFLKQQKMLNLRFMIWDQDFYRKEKLEAYFSRTVQEGNFKHVLVQQQLLAPLIKGTLVNELMYTRKHYSI